ncbi:MAG: nucleotidyltransferase domain-containing protein [Caldiserica bacterium]|jgi:predicted nucleotidyltransferase|nr:nucleotidyltransferase domain-containing protein [Caldisericota bacterium]
MPVRLLSSSVLKWPDREIVLQAFRSWAEKAQADPRILGIGLFGSLVQGNWEPGGDLDAILILKESPLPFIERGREFDLMEIPVPVDLLVYTLKEWERLEEGHPHGLPSRVEWLYRDF